MLTELRSPNKIASLGIVGLTRSELSHIQLFLNVSRNRPDIVRQIVSILQEVTMPEAPSFRMRRVKKKSSRSLVSAAEA